MNEAQELQGLLEAKGKLPSETNTPKVEKQITKAARAEFGRKKFNLFFEHGHWWCRVEDFEEEGEDTTFDVVDASPGKGGTQFDFEKV